MKDDNFNDIITSTRMYLKSPEASISQSAILFKTSLAILDIRRTTTPNEEKYLFIEIPTETMSRTFLSM